MDNWLQRNQQGLALAVGVLALIPLGLLFLGRLPSDLHPAALLLMPGGAIFIILALIGDRLTELGGGGLTMKMIARRVAEETKRAVGKGSVQHKTETSARGTAHQRTAHDSLTVVDGVGAIVAPAPKVEGSGNVVVTPETARAKVRVYPPTVIVSGDPIRQAKTPEELANRVVEFVRTADRYDRQAVLDYLAELTPDDRSRLLAEAEAVSEERHGE